MGFAAFILGVMTGLRGGPVSATAAATLLGLGDCAMWLAGFGPGIGTVILSSFYLCSGFALCCRLRASVRARRSPDTDFA
ncbi:MAG TPA: hypothetical protein VIL84_00340 [Devosiaceae bacterium]